MSTSAVGFYSGGTLSWELHVTTVYFIGE